MGPDEQIEGNLKGAGVENILAPHHHVDQREHQVADVSVDQGADFNELRWNDVRPAGVFRGDA